MKGILILGTGGHAKVAADIALEMGLTIAGFLDDNVERQGQTLLGFPVLGAVTDWRTLVPEGLALGIGSNQSRQKLMVDHPDAPWVTLVHPRATISRFASIGEGTMVAFGVCIGPDAHIGRGAIINTCASVDHDNYIGDYAHIAVGATLAGHVEVGEGALVGAGCVTKPGVRIGSWSVIGAGAAVVTDIPAGVTAVGVPARWPMEHYGMS